METALHSRRRNQNEKMASTIERNISKAKAAPSHPAKLNVYEGITNTYREYSVQIENKGWYNRLHEKVSTKCYHILTHTKKMVQKAERQRKSEQNIYV